MNSNMVKPGKYDDNVHLFYNIATTTIFNLVINFLVGWYMENSLLVEQIGLFK